MPFLISVLFYISTSVVAWEGDTFHDFGDIVLHENYIHEFTFVNIAEEPIRIDNIRPSCGCTIPNWDKRAIAPDSSAVIKVQYRPRQTGFTRKMIKVYFSGQRKAEKIYVEGFVERK